MASVKDSPWALWIWADISHRELVEKGEDADQGKVAPGWKDFYDALMPRAEEAIAYCDRHPLDVMPDEVKNLVYVLCSLIEASFPAECWKQVRVPDTGAARVDCILQPVL